MSTKLQDFREQYPQYSHLSDEELAEGIRQKYYTDMDPDQYREQIGLPPAIQPEEPPSIWDRVTSVFRDEREKPTNIMAPEPQRFDEFDQDRANPWDAYETPAHISGTPYQLMTAEEDLADRNQEPRELYRDQLFAGLDEWRAGRLLSSAISAAEQFHDADRIARGLGPGETAENFGGVGINQQMWDKFNRGRRADAYINDPEQFSEYRDDYLAVRREEEQIRANMRSIMAEAIDRAAVLRERAATVEFGQGTRDMMEAETFSEGWAAFKDDPVNIVIETSLRSLPNMTEGLVLGTAAAVAGGGPVGFAFGVGTGSGMTEYRNSFQDYLAQAGVDWSDADSVVAVMTNEELLRAAHEYAQKRSLVIGGTSALGGYIATKPLTPFVGNVVGRELSNAAAQMVVQPVLEGAGEAGAQAWADGEIKPGEVMAEMAGSLVEAPIEVGSAAVSGARAQHIQNRTAQIESEVNEILGRGDYPAREGWSEIDPTYEWPDGTIRTEPPPEVDPEARQEPEVEETARVEPDPITPEESGVDPDLVPDQEPDIPATDDIPEVSQEDEIAAATDEVQYADQRLRRGIYRDHLVGMADELVPNGGVTYIYDENDVIIGRTGSVNPDWFQSMNADPDYRMSVRQVQNAVNKAVRGRPLGVRETRVVQAMTDMITERRLQDVDYARDQLERARQERRAAREAAALPDDRDLEISAEAFEEDEYAPEMTAESRMIFELMEQATAFGVTEDTLERLAIQYGDNDQGLMNALERVINETERAPRTAAMETEPKPRPVPDTQTDLLGDDELELARRQELADEIRRRDELRNEGQESVETGDPGDLFSQANRQVDIEDVGVLDSRVPGSVRSRQPQRTQDRRQRVRNMSLDELVEELYTDPLTGLGNRQAFEEESPHHNWLASIDADNLKWINDNLGHDAGDALLAAIGEAINQTDVEAYRIGGDEFYIGGETRTAVESAINLANGILAQQEIRSPSGKVFGLEMTAGIGETKAAADSRMEIEKKRKKGRAERGDKPQNAVLSVKANKPLDMAPGTNYVPLIGHTGTLPIDPEHNLILGTTGKHVRIPKTPVRREHILAIMQRYFGKRIYQGRVRGKLRLGFYRPGQGEVRIKNANDIEVAAHEIAHFLDDRYPWIANLYGKFSDEVKSVSYDVNQITEGWAEFMRLWMTQDFEAQKRTPSFYDAFNQELKKHPKLEQMLLDLQEAMHAWTMQGARARLASKHDTTQPSIMERIRRHFTNNWFQAGLDGLRSIGESGAIQADLADHEAHALQEGYEKLRVALGGSNGVLEAAVYWGTPKWRADKQGIELGGESLMDVFGDDWGNNDLALYMMARRAQELAGQGRENLIRPDEIAMGLRIGEENPHFADIFSRYQQYNERMLDFAQESGILGAETRAAIEEMNKNYVPFHRVIESQIDGKSVRAGGNPFMTLRGGSQNLNNLFDNIVNNTGHIIRTAMVNDGKRSVLKVFGGTDRLGAGQRSGNAGIYAAPIARETRPTKIATEEILKKVVESLGFTWNQYRTVKETGMYTDESELALVQMVDAMAAGMGELATFWQPSDPQGKDVDFYLEDGQKVFFQINDPNLMDSLQFVGPRGSNWLLATVGAFSSVLRRGVTSVPVFQIKNFIRDAQSAWLLSTNVKVPAARALRVVFSKMREDPQYVEMMLNGGGFANRLQGLTAQRKTIVDPTRLVAIYDRFMARFENANRLAEYQAARAAGESPRRAALLSREISTDFAMRGSSEIARYIAIAVPFLNARVQGLYRVKRQFNSQELAVSYAMRGMLLMGAGVTLYMLNKDDERYEEMPEDIKDLNYVFFTGDGEDDYFLMPKAFENGLLFGTLPERMIQLTEDRDGKEFADAMGWMFLEAFNMDMVPQVFQPLLDLERNKNFTGAPIVPMYLDGASPTQQYTYYTSTTVREAAQAMGVSPIKMEHLLRGYTGTLGAYAIGASDALIRWSTEPEERLFGEDPTRGETWRENLLVRALIDPLVQEGPMRRTKYTTDLYDMIREAETVARDVALIQAREVQNLEAYINDDANALQLGMRPALVSARSALREIRQQIDVIRQNTELTGDEKRVQIWELTRARNQIARETVIALRELEGELEQQQRAAGAQ